MVAYNSLARLRTEWLRLPVPASRRVAVQDGAGRPIAFSTLPTPDHPELQTIAFSLAIPPLGIATAFVVFTGDTEAGAEPQREAPVDAVETIENGVYRIAFDTVTGLTKSITDLRTGVTTAVSGLCGLNDW